MTPLDLMRRRTVPLRLVVFDCDGVLVDSEPVANRVVAAELTALGWAMTAAESTQTFLGLSFPEMVPMIERRLGRALDRGWSKMVEDRVVVAMAAEATAVPGAVAALDGVEALGLAWRVASNSSHEEMAAKFGRLGLAARVAGRLHSYRDVARGKPAPDIYLAAAAAQGVDPAACVVVEDSAVGATAARAAGMDCLGFASHDDGARLRAVGAVPFRAMSDLPALFAAAVR